MTTIEGQISEITAKLKQLADKQLPLHEVELGIHKELQKLGLHLLDDYIKLVQEQKEASLVEEQKKTALLKKGSPPENT